jgi:hypothetical protein
MGIYEDLHRYDDRVKPPPAGKGDASPYVGRFGPAVPLAPSPSQRHQQRGRRAPSPTPGSGSVVQRSRSQSPARWNSSVALASGRDTVIAVDEVIEEEERAKSVLRHHSVTFTTETTLLGQRDAGAPVSSSLSSSLSRGPAPASSASIMASSSLQHGHASATGHAHHLSNATATGPGRIGVASALASSSSMRSRSKSPVARAIEARREAGEMPEDEARSLADWLLSAAGLRIPAKQLADGTFARLFSDGTLLCRALSKLERTELQGVTPNPTSRGARFKNISVALEVLRSNRRMPIDHLWSLELILAGDAATIAGLLRGMRRAYPLAAKSSADTHPAHPEPGIDLSKSKFAAAARTQLLL